VTFTQCGDSTKYFSLQSKIVTHIEMIERIDFNIAAETKLTADVVFFRNMPSNVLVDVSMCD